MPADGIWRTLERLASVIGLVGALVALGLVATSRASASSSCGTAAAETPRS